MFFQLDTHANAETLHSANQLLQTVHFTFIVLLNLTHIITAVLANKGKGKGKGKLYLYSASS